VPLLSAVNLELFLPEFPLWRGVGRVSHHKGYSAFLQPMFGAPSAFREDGFRFLWYFFGPVFLGVDCAHKGLKTLK